MEVILIKAFQLILSLSILVALHELGHFIPARLFGTRVEKFYLFFDWPFSLFKKKIGDKTFLNLSYKRSFSLNDQSQLGVEYKLNRHFSVVANVGKDGNYNVKYRYKYAY